MQKAHYIKIDIRNQASIPKVQLGKYCEIAFSMHGIDFANLPK